MKDNVLRAVSRFIQDEQGATAIEYGLIAGLIAVAIIGSVSTMGGALERAYQALADKLLAAFPAAAKTN